MSLLTSVIVVLAVIVIYALLIEIYSVLFRLTGLTKDKARFQTISLLTGCGFTTGESEIITNDKNRRKIAVWAMITGYGFSVIIVTLLINLVQSVRQEDVMESLDVIIIAFCSFIVLLIVCQLPFVKKFIEKIIEGIANALIRRNTMDNVITLLDSYGKDAIAEVYINKLPDHLVDKTIFESHVKKRFNVNFLMVRRNGKTVDVTKDTIINRKDTVVVFGSLSGIRNCFTKTTVETEKNVIELIEEYGDEAMAEIHLNHIPECLDNKGLFESGLKSVYNLNLLTIKRGETIVPITKDTILSKGDIVVIFGLYSSIREVFSEKEEEE